MFQSRYRNIQLIFIVVGLVFLAAYFVWWRPLPFDSDTWKSAAGDYTSSIRYRMRHGAVKMLASGFVKSEEHALLFFGNSDLGADSNRWLYRLGPQFFPVDSFWLDLRFDEHGEIAAYQIRVD